MPFAKITERKPYDSQFKKTEFIDLPAGNHSIRILDTGAHSIFNHYVRNAYIECLGEDCPVCKSNKQIILSNPKDFKQVPGYSSRTERFLTNVLDRTPAKLCPTCGKYTKKAGQAYPVTCVCGAVLTGVAEAPINKVRVLAKGKDLFSQFNVLEETVLDANTEPIGINNFDITLVVSGVGRDTKIIAVPMTSSNDVVEVPEDDKFDVKNVSLKLTEEEIASLLNGVAVRDILLGRSANVSAEEDIETEDTALAEDVAQSIKDIFES
jgi:hypothetical protein